MPTKRVIKQKQKQKQSVDVNVNLAKAKARAKSSAKKSGAKGGGRGSVMMLPPPIYASPIDRLTPGMYNSQGQQIQQRGIEDLLRNFLSNQQNQQTNTGFKSLGRAEPQLRSTSEFIPYDDSSNSSFRSLGSLSSLPGSSSLSYTPKSLGSWSNVNSDSSLGSSTTSRYPILSSVGSSLSSRSLLDDEYYAINPLTGQKQRYLKPIPDDISELTDPTYMSEYSSDFTKPMSTESQYDRALASPFTSDIPIPFQNEEKSYLKTAEPNYEKNAPKFTDTPPESITEIIKRPEKRKPVRVDLDEESITYQGTPATRASGTPASQVNIIPFEDEMSSDSLSNFSGDSLNTNPFPKNIFNKMMGFN